MPRMLSETDPAAVREMMNRTQATMDRDATIARRIHKATRHAAKMFGWQAVGNSGDEDGMYGPTE